MGVGHRRSVIKRGPLAVATTKERSQLSGARYGIAWRPDTRGAIPREIIFLKNPKKSRGWELPIYVQMGAKNRAAPRQPPVHELNPVTPSQRGSS
jgi:hypothetical protein